ncbi:MAG: elongation factor P [Alphaproteobacteria bacterium]
MKISGNEVRPGMILDYNNKLWRVSKIQITRAAMGRAFNQVEMKCLTDGTKLNERFRSDEALERAQLEQKQMQYLFDDGSSLTFMDNTTYEQATLSYDVVGDQRVWLQESMNVKVELYDGNPIGVELPTTVACEVEMADPVVKGQTASSSYKPAKLTNGQNILVPPYVEMGMKILVNTADSTFSGRA